MCKKLSNEYDRTKTLKIVGISFDEIKNQTAAQLEKESVDLKILGFTYFWEGNDCVASAWNTGGKLNLLLTFSSLCS